MTQKETLIEILSELNNLCVTADDLETDFKNLTKEARSVREKLEDVSERLEQALKVEIELNDEGLATQEGD